MTAAKISWQASTPVSVQFDDFYFSTDDGINESRYVYLQANQLPERFSEGPIERPFIVAETGFGSGLNFLLTWQAWRQHEKAKRPLHYFSIEKFPLSEEDLSKALSCWPELSSLVDQLLDQYPALIKGSQSLEFESNQVRLSLLFGDVETDLQKTSFYADTWFLDGFSPKKNPEMWSEDFFNLIAQRSKHGTHFSTFTSASIVRQRLKAADFQVEKQEGFGKKREMLFGQYTCPAERKHKTSLPNWYFPANDDVSTASVGQCGVDYDAAIIGSGLSGLNTAYELAQQGLRVCLIDSKSGPVQEASGQSQLAMYAKLPTEANKLFRFTVQALSDSVRFYHQIQSSNAEFNTEQFWFQTGLLQLAWCKKELEKQTRFLNSIDLPSDIIRGVDASFAADVSGLDIDAPGLWFEQAGWLNPKIFAKYILRHPLIDTRYNTEVETLRFSPEQDAWTICASNGATEVRANHVIMATANNTKGFHHFKHLPTKPLRGQVTSLYSKELQASKTVVCGEGYLCPAVNNWHHFGATFDLEEQQAIVKAEDTEKNINSIQNWLPGWLNEQHINPSEINSSAGLRCTSPDYLPIVGRAPIAESMIQDFAKLRVDSNACQNTPGHYYPKLYVNVGHGSKGLMTTPLAAKIIRYHICGGLPPCLDEHLLMLSPTRFLIKHLTQRRI